MNKRKIKFFGAVAVVTILVGMHFPVLSALASDTLIPSQTVTDGWAVTELAMENPVRQVESFKVDRDFIAWTEVDNEAKTRRLYAFDGARTSLVATMSRQEWDMDYGNGFFDSVEGNYGLADGLLVWTASDGLDREIWSFNGFSVSRVSDNTYDDNHPVTSLGRTAWTSYPGTNYNLMIKDGRGIRRLDGWHVLNYDFSGKNLFWVNRLPQEDWFRVFREDGQVTVAVGKGDDRPVVGYFLTDGTGTAAWEYSTKQWGYDKRETFISYRGGQARRVIQRDVPPNVTRLEDIDGNSVILNVTDLLQSAVLNRVSLIKTNGIEEYPARFTSPIKVRNAGNGQFVRHLVPDTSSALIIGNGSSNENFILNEHVIHDRFEAEDGLVAGALLAGGMLVRTDDRTFTIPTNGQVSRLDIGGGCIVWTEGETPNGKLRSACPTVSVRDSNGRLSKLSGRLVKTAGNPSVYLAGIDGRRYLFPSESQFYGWYGDFSTVRTISSAEMQTMSLAGTVLLRPGYVPVKIASDPKVYAVTGEGELRWVTTGETMTELYGEGWERKVAIIPDSSLTDYRFGSPIYDSVSGHYALATWN